MTADRVQDIPSVRGRTEPGRCRSDSFRRLVLTLLCICLTMSLPAQQPPRTGEMKSGEVSVIRVAARRHGLRDLQLKTRNGPSGRLIVEGFEATLGGGTIRGTGHVDFAAPDGSHWMRVQLEKVEAAAFLTLLEVKLDAAIESSVDGEFELQWRGTAGPDIRRTLNGTARWTAAPGHVTGAEVLKQAAGLTGIDELRTFRFSEAGASGVFREGVLDVQSLRVSGPDQEVSGTGTLDVTTAQVRMALQMRISPEMVRKSSMPQLRAVAILARGARAGQAGDERKRERLLRLPMRLRMTGEMQDPRFEFGDWEIPGVERSTGNSGGSSGKGNRQ